MSAIAVDAVADLQRQLEELKAAMSRSSTPAAPTPAPAPQRGFERFDRPPFEGNNDPEGALAFMAALKRHVTDNAAYYPNPDDARIVNAAGARLSGNALKWFDGLAVHDPTVLSSFSAFEAEFKSAFAASAGLVNHFSRLRAHKMGKGTVETYTSGFNALIARLPSAFRGKDASPFLCDAFRAGLPEHLASALETARVSRHGGNTEWPSVDLMQAAAADLSRSSLPVRAARPFAPRVSSSMTAQEADDKGGCRYCRALDHRKWQCPEWKALPDVTSERVEGARKGDEAARKAADLGKD
jgi:hypothetical protein